MAIVATTSLMSSCLSDDDNTETSPVCMIASFSVGDFTSTYTTKTAAGKDTTFNRTISGSSILFNIDQVNGVIYNVDSLPNWARISSLVPTVTAMGVVLCRQGGEGAEYKFLNNGKDSIDFTKDVDFMVYSLDGNTSKHYKAHIYQSELNADSLYWTPMDQNLSLDGPHRTVAKGDNIYVFAENDGNPTVASSLGTQKIPSWNEPQNMDTKINCQSIIVKDDSFYALDYDGYVYFSTDGVTWTKQSTIQLERLLAADRQLIYGFDGTSMVSSGDGAAWNEEEAANLSFLPMMPASYSCYNTKTNAELQNVVMIGASTAADNAVTWFKISSSSEDSDQNWNYINITSDNPYAMPKLANIQMVRYNSMLIAFGGKSSDGKTEAYKNIYVSHDNGITWHVPEEKMSLPSDWNSTSNIVTMTVCGKYIWAVESNGRTWRGEISNN